MAQQGEGQGQGEGEISIATEVECETDPKRAFDATVKDAHVLLPKLLPNVFASVTYEGENAREGVPGSVRHIAFSPAASTEFSFVKERVDLVDQHNLIFKYTVVDGGLLGKRVSSARTEVKFLPRSDGHRGCIMSHTVFMVPLPGVPPPDEAAIQRYRNSLVLGSRALDAYLNPHLNLPTQ